MAPDIALAIAKVAWQLSTAARTSPFREKVSRQVARRQSTREDKRAVTIHRKTIVVGTHVKRCGRRCFMTHRWDMEPTPALPHQTLFTQVSVTADQYCAQKGQRSRFV
jgi:hypothetical protein